VRPCTIGSGLNCLIPKGKVILPYLISFKSYPAGIFIGPTYLFAVLTLLVVRVPSPERSAAGAEGKGSLWKEALYGWTYISTRAGLLGLLLIFAAFNFVTGLIMPLITPMILDMASADMLGYLMSIVGVGMLAGTLLMSAWGGPKRKKVPALIGFITRYEGRKFLKLRPEIIEGFIHLPRVIPLIWC